MDKLDWIQWVRERSGAGQDGAMGELANELAMERATTLARLGQRLDGAIERLRELRAQPVDPEVLEADQQALALLRELRWEYLVVKEAMGFRGIRQDLDRYWPVPPPIRADHARVATGR